MTTTDRLTYILEQCTGRKVLHLGCTDWPYTERKLAGGALLHAKLQEVTAALVGVDADQAGVAYFQQHGFPETYFDNVERLEHPGIARQSYDVILAGEIIEHLENPGVFLRTVQKLMNERTELLVTTINAFCFFRFLFYLCGKELVHEDHNYYFSPTVLRRLLTRCGLEVTECLHYAIGREIRALNPRRIVWLDDVGRTLFPRASDGLIMKARRAHSGPGASV